MKECQKLSKELNIEKHVRFLGRLEQKEVAKKMSESDIFVLASIVLEDGRTESLGMVLAEAGASGLPLIGSNVGGIPEIVINNKTGLTFEEKNYHELSEKISSLIENTKTRKEMGSTASKFTKKNYNTKVQNQLLKNYYEKIL